VIINALVRIEGKKGAAPSPFEQPSPNSSFWVLELALPKKEEKAQIRWLTVALKKQRKLIRQHTGERKDAVLFLGLSSRRAKPVVFGAAFVQVISDLGLGLEIYEEEA
jgi:hypothetical protein